MDLLPIPTIWYLALNLFSQHIRSATYPLILMYVGIGQICCRSIYIVSTCNSMSRQQILGTHCLHIRCTNSSQDPSSVGMSSGKLLYLSMVTLAHFLDRVISLIVVIHATANIS
jgi:hypothetical protein